MRKFRLSAIVSTAALTVALGVIGGGPAYAAEMSPTIDGLTDEADLTSVTSPPPVSAAPQISAVAPDGDTTAIPMADLPAIEISQTVTANYVRVHAWDLEKTGAVGEITVNGDAATADIDFTVTATPASFEDKYHSLAGEITVTNTTVETLTGQVSVGADIDTASVCRVTDPVDDRPVVDAVVPAASTVTYEFRCSQFESTPSVYGASIVDFVWAGGIESSVVGFEFTQISESFGSVTIVDDHADPTGSWVELGAARWNADRLPFVFEYTLTVEDLSVGECTELTNTAVIAERELFTETTVTVCPEAAVTPPSAIDPGPTPVEAPPATVTPEPTAVASLAATGSDASLLPMLGVALLSGGIVLVTWRRLRAASASR
ncbi:MAG: LPXTG cell wall anchor domain-containing protein [Leucobacter sp.]